VDGLVLTNVRNRQNKTTTSSVICG